MLRMTMSLGVRHLIDVKSAGFRSQLEALATLNCDTMKQSVSGWLYIYELFVDSIIFGRVRAHLFAHSQMILSITQPL